MSPNSVVKKQLNAASRSNKPQPKGVNMTAKAKGNAASTPATDTPPAASMTVDAEVVSSETVPPKTLGQSACETASNVADTILGYVSTPTGKKVAFYGIVGVFVAWKAYKYFSKPKAEAPTAPAE